jgi:hypothetical protein
MVMSERLLCSKDTGKLGCEKSPLVREAKNTAISCHDAGCKNDAATIQELAPVTINDLAARSEMSP